MTIKEIYKNMEYGPAPENADLAHEFLDDHSRKFQLYINGKWEKPASKKYFKSINPSTNEELAQISDATEKDVDKAVQAAKAALSGWRKIGGHQRAKYMYAIARQIQKHARLFAVLEALDNGKPIRETRDIDIPLVARHFYHHAGWAQLMDTEFSDYKEVGVVGQIIPWNFPLLMLSWKIAPAIAMGNTLVIKPAEFTSLTALLFAEICDQVGLPKGVVNVVTGDAKAGAAIVAHKDISKIAFTGSTEVGKIIRRATAGSGKKLSLELGGKSPFIVFEDADLDSVVEGVVDAIWFNQGQVCCAGSRLLVQESIAEKLYRKIRKRMEKLRIGNALDKSIDMGAIVDPVQLKTIEDLVQQGVDEGNTLWQPSWKCPKNGCYYPPTLFTDVSPSATLAQEEIFGPVLVAMTFRTHKEAVKLANNTVYGLASSVWTENINLALDIAPQIKAGIVWINCSNVMDAASGFGGYRESGFGREGGREGLYEYMKLKSTGKESSQSFYKKNTAGKKSNSVTSPTIDRTAKQYIGGKQSRPDGGYSMKINSAAREHIGEVALGNRKDIRNAVEVASKSSKWRNLTGHSKAQILYYMAENLSARREEFAQRLIQMTNRTEEQCHQEVEESINRIYTFAAYADKYDGRVHHTTHKNVTLAMPESLGTMGIICPDDFPLLGFITMVTSAITMGNNVVVVPSEKFPFSATDLYQILDTSDVPAGTISIVTGKKDELAMVLASHDNVDGIWYHGSKEGSTQIELKAAENMKRTWVNYGKHIDWTSLSYAAANEYLRKASEIKNIWIPYGA